MKTTYEKQRIARDQNQSIIKLSQSQLDINDPTLTAIFEDTQGNILKSHGRAHSRHLFLQFTADANRNREWVGKLASRLTSAMEQHRTALDFKDSGHEHLFTGFMLSYSGYQALGIADQEIPDDKAFRAGMKNLDFSYDTGPGGVHKRTVNPLNDTPKNWEDHFKQKIDALVVLAYGGENLESKICEDYLDIEVKKLTSEIAETATIVGMERGYILSNEKGETIEHFGFVDGVSNPVFFKSDYERWEKKEGTTRYDPSAPFGLIAVNDPGGYNENTSFGSYFVYRKMQQNIKGFIDQTKAFAALLSAEAGHEITPEYAGALLLGRFKDGTPLIAATEKKENNSQNNFNYDQDTEGLTCPFQSHIRKTNPRGDTHRVNKVPMRSERSHRIARRGISYGDRDLRPNTEWTDAGLLFLSCQSDIEQQFLVMQCGWSDNSNFVNQGTGTDPITGAQNAGSDNTIPKWQLQIDGKKITVKYRYKDLVRMRGGEYFFAPSISFCKKINLKHS